MIYRSIHKNKNGEICWRHNTQQNDTLNKGIMAQHKGIFNKDITAQHNEITKQHIDDVTSKNDTMA